MQVCPGSISTSPLNRREFLQSTAAVGAGWLLAVPAGAQAEQPSTSAPAAGTEQKEKIVAILVFDGMELLDFAGPAEVFIAADRGRVFRVCVVAEKDQPVKTNGKVTIHPDFTCANAPHADIVVIPGGDTSNLGAAGRAWVKKAAAEAEITLSVCTGAFVLAEAGLLDGLNATTHHLALTGLAKAAPQCTVVRDRRFVDSGKIVTAAGVTAGIDAALHIVERLLGAEAARWTADVWMEHPRQAATPKS